MAIPARGGCVWRDAPMAMGSEAEGVGGFITLGAAGGATHVRGDFRDFNFLPANRFHAASSSGLGKASIGIRLPEAARSNKSQNLGLFERIRVSRSVFSSIGISKAALLPFFVTTTGPVLGNASITSLKLFLTSRKLSIFIARTPHLR